jgi:hypothetical protein
MVGLSEKGFLSNLFRLPRQTGQTDFFSPTMTLSFSKMWWICMRFANKRSKGKVL